MDGVSAQRTRRAHRVDGIHCHRRATIYAKLQFDAQMYDSYEDNDTFSRGNVTATIKGAWAPAERRGAIAHRQLRREAARERGPHDWVPVGDVRLIFNDGGEVKFALDQRAMSYPQERERSDKFIAAIRARARI
jgi:hypothetical protein